MGVAHRGRSPDAPIVEEMRYEGDVLARARHGVHGVPEIAAEPDLVVETVDGRFCGAVVAIGRAVDSGEKRDTVVLEDRHGKRREFPMLPASFMVDGRTVTLVRPAPKAPAKHARAKTASGSYAVAGARARVARESRIWVEGVHDAALLERIWGDDLRIEGIVVEPLEGIDHLAEHVRAFGPGPQRRVGVLVDHLVAGSKETRIAAEVRRLAVRPGHRAPVRRRVAGGQADRARHRRVAGRPSRHRLEDGRLRRPRSERAARDVAPRARVASTATPTSRYPCCGPSRN